MPVKMWTGKPGAGKTARMVHAIMQFKKENPQRPVYAINVNGLHESVAEPLSYEQLQKWWELPPESLICIDEAQEDDFNGTGKGFFPLDQGKPAPWVRRISKVRHEGMDFWFTTQHPDLVSAYVRRLVDQHIHYVRKFNSSVVSAFQWGRCMTSCEEPRAQRTAVHSITTLPAEVFELYKSSNAHNMKRKIPLRALVLPIAAVVAIGALVGVPLVLKRLHDRTTHVATASPVKPGSNAPAAVASSENADQEMRREDFAKWMKPRLAGIPWSAPMFDTLTVKAQPRLYCVAVEDGRCGCVTEQGTRYAVPVDRCRSIAADGLYNPFVDADEASQRQRQPQQASAAQQPTAGGGVVLASVPGPQRAVRATATPYTPPEYGEWNADPFSGK
ncbi:MAG TPA: zonular occludens toxin domain-containing protein [Steroidobacteraceae bacterium]|nr:zonular occludens toxin domain-containing protein [Steroidobacteraceae bacterium]